jgi:hypothetical protein
MQPYTPKRERGEAEAGSTAVQPDSATPQAKRVGRTVVQLSDEGDSIVEVEPPADPEHSVQELSSGEDSSRCPTLDGLPPEEIRRFDQHLDYDGGPGSDAEDPEVAYYREGETSFRNPRRVWKRRFQEVSSDLKAKWLVDEERVFQNTGSIDLRREEKPLYHTLINGLLNELNIARGQSTHVEQLRRQLFNEGKVQDDLRRQVTELSGQVIDLRHHIRQLEQTRAPLPRSTPDLSSMQQGHLAGGSTSSSSDPRPALQPTAQAYTWHQTSL